MTTALQTNNVEAERVLALIHFAVSIRERLAHFLSPIGHKAEMFLNDRQEHNHIFVSIQQVPDW
jgi:hypothetical protein